MNGREMSRQTSVKQTNAQTQRNRASGWSKVPTDARRPRRKMQFKQQRQRQLRLKIRLYVQPTNLARM